MMAADNEAEEGEEWNKKNDREEKLNDINFLLIIMLNHF